MPNNINLNKIFQMPGRAGGAHHSYVYLSL